MSANLEKIIEELSKLTVLEAAELAKKLEEEWGVSAAAPVAVAAAPAAGGGAADAAAEPTSFDVKLADIGANKLNVIKIVRELTGLGLGEAKAAVEGLKVLKEGVDKKTAEEMKAKIEEAGGKVELIGHA